MSYFFREKKIDKNKQQQQKNLSKNDHGGLAQFINQKNKKYSLCKVSNVVTDDRSEIFKKNNTFVYECFLHYDAVHDQLCQFHLTKNRGNFKFAHNFKTIFSLFFFTGFQSEF